MLTKKEFKKIKKFVTNYMGVVDDKYLEEFIHFRKEVLEIGKKLYRSFVAEFTLRSIKLFYNEFTFLEGTTIDIIFVKHYIADTKLENTDFIETYLKSAGFLDEGFIFQNFYTLLGALYLHNVDVEKLKEFVAKIFDIKSRIIYFTDDFDYKKYFEDYIKKGDLFFRKEVQDNCVVLFYGIKEFPFISYVSCKNGVYDENFEYENMYYTLKSKGLIDFEEDNDKIYNIKEENAKEVYEYLVSKGKFPKCYPVKNKKDNMYYILLGNRPHGPISDKGFTSEKDIINRLYYNLLRPFNANVEEMKKINHDSFH